VDPVVTLSGENLVVEPGSEVSTTVRIRNTSEVVEEYDLTLLGEVAAYGEIIPPQVSAFVGDVAEATVIIRPPFDTMISSGQIPFGIRAESKEDADRVEVAEGELTVGAINLLQTKLLPSRSSGRWTSKARVEIHNRGTEDQTVRLRTVDPDQKLSFALAPREVDVAPGGTTEAFLKIRPRKRMIMGSAAHVPFQVSYRRKAGVRDAYLGATTGGDTEAFVDSSFEQKPIVAKWMIAALMLVLIVGGLIIFRAQTTDIVVAPANPIQAPQPPTAFVIESSIDQLTIKWEPPVSPPSGYTITSADPALYAEGTFDLIAEPDIGPLGPQERSFTLAVEGGASKCLFIQSFLDGSEATGSTSSLMVGLASPSGVLVSDLPAGNCISAQRADQCAAPVVTSVNATDDPVTWTVNWDYGEGCDTSGNAVWTLSVNGEPGSPLDDSGLRATNVDLSSEAVNGLYTIRVSPGDSELETTFDLDAGLVAAEVRLVEQEEEEAGRDGRRPEGSYAVVIGHRPSEKLPVSTDDGSLSLAGMLEQLFDVLLTPRADGGVGLDVRRVFYGPVDVDSELGAGMTLIRLPDPVATDYYLIVDSFGPSVSAQALCDELETLLIELTETDWLEEFPLGDRPDPCVAVSG
jgi:hypothetical protein